MLQPAIANTYVIGTRYPHRGIAGGRAGAPNRLVLNAGSANEMLVEETAFMCPWLPASCRLLLIGRE